MRRRFLVGMGLVLGTGALAAGAANGVAARTSAAKRKVQCTASTYNVSYPKLSGLGLSVLKCSKPLGDGVQKATTKASIVGTAINVTGTFTNYFAAGSVRGTLKLSGKLSPGSTTASGPVNLTGGTGAYRHIKGAGKASCTTTDVGKTYHCTVNGTVTF